MSVFCNEFRERAGGGGNKMFTPINKGNKELTLTAPLGLKRPTPFISQRRDAMQAQWHGVWHAAYHPITPTLT